MNRRIILFKNHRREVIRMVPIHRRFQHLKRLLELLGFGVLLLKKSLQFLCVGESALA